MSLAYFPLYPTDFDGKTAHLTFAEDGAYNRLLRLSWTCPEAKLPNDLNWICRKVRAVTPDDKALIAAILAEFFTRKGGKIYSDRLHKEWVKANAAHKERISRASKGGAAKALKEKEMQAASSTAQACLKDANQNQNQNHTEEEIPKGILVPPIDEIAECVAAYNAAADRAGWPKVQAVNKARRAALGQRLRGCGGATGWEVALAKAEASDFLCGRTSTPFKASFDFLTQASSFTKLMEGNYDNRVGNPATPRRSGMVDAFAAVAAQRSGRA